MPIQYSCPQCGKQTVVADQFAGQTGPCAACGATVTIPAAMPAGVPQYGAPAAAAAAGAGIGTVLAVVFGVIALFGLVCAGILAALLLPAIGAARDAAKRAQSQNNLKQMSLALMNYHDTHNQYPPAVVTDANGQPLYSGRVLLLPYLEQGSLYDRFDKTKAWNSPENQAISDISLKVFLDPASASGNTSRSDYVFVTGTGTVFEAGKKIRMADITDGTTNTLVLLETSAGPSSWAEPGEWNADTGTLPPGNRKQVILYALADGSVRASPPPALQGVAKNLATRSDGQAVSPP